MAFKVYSFLVPAIQEENPCLGGEMWVIDDDDEDEILIDRKIQWFKPSYCLEPIVWSKRTKIAQIVFQPLFLD